MLGKIVDVTVGLRVSDKEEEDGLDITQHGEEAYDDSADEPESVKPVIQTAPSNLQKQQS